MRKKSNPTIFRKTLAVILLAVFVSFSPLQAKNSSAWTNIPAAYLKENLEEIYNYIQGVILGILKQQALKMLNSQIEKIIGGSSTGSAMFITNWRDYLVKNPEKATKTYMNDYLSQITSGRGSISGYSSEGFLSGGLGSLLGSGGGGGGYQSQLVQMAKREVVNPPKPKVTYPGDPSQMFASGNFKNMSLYFSGINNPWAFEINAEQEYQKRLEEEKKIAETKGVAYSGFKGKEKTKSSPGGGKEEFILNPGSIVKEAVANVQDLGNKILASATHPEEVITAVVSQMISKALQMGIGQVEKIIDQEVSKITNSTSTEMNSRLNTSGPASQYNSRTSPWTLNGDNIYVPNPLD